MTTQLSDAMTKAIDAELAHYPNDHRLSAIIGSLMAVQRLNGGYLEEALINAVADYIDIPRISAFEVATFYSMFNLSPCGRYQLSVCNNISCMLNGSEALIEVIQSELGIREGEVSQDGVFSFKAVSCLGHCDQAPMLQINDQSCVMKLTPERMRELLSQLRREVENVRQ